MALISNKPKTLKSVLEELISSQGWEDEVFKEELRKQWPDIVGEKIANATIINKFKDGELFLRTKSSTWRVELRIRSENIIKIINEKFGENIVKKLIIR